jgi:alpha-L-fucosidase
MTGLILLTLPADGKFEAPGLQSKVVKAYLLDGRRELKVAQSTGGVNISLPAEAPDHIASVICLEIADPIAKVASITTK